MLLEKTPAPVGTGPPDKDSSSLVSARNGVIFGLCAYTMWGFFPLFFKALGGVPALEILAHRIFWSAVFLVLIVAFRLQISTVRRAFHFGPLLGTLCVSTLLISINWLVFIYAVERGEVLQTSLGYFITPLVSILLGTIFLKERLNHYQQLSVALAALGVVILAFYQEGFPWMALLLACSFGLYGLLRKIARIDALVGLTVETLLLAPFSLAYLLVLHDLNLDAFLSGPIRYDLLLPLSGVITAVPLLLFIGAARRLRLATIGFLQYIAPTLHFILAVWVFKEPFSAIHLSSFMLIWVGLVIYSGDALLDSRAGRRGGHIGKPK